MILLTLKKPLPPGHEPSRGGAGKKKEKKVHLEDYRDKAKQNID